MGEPEAENVQTKTKVYDNELMYQKCIDLLIKQTSDVQFIFEDDGDSVKVAANKAVLAASSPVFDAMFNGDLKEEGDVKMVDVSSAAFKEFLELFYGHQVKLTIDNIAEVLKLVDKYDVAGCFPICVNFLKDHLEVDDILWGLHLAIKFKLDDLKAFCSTEIQKNFNQILGKFDFMDDGKVKLLVNTDGRFIPEDDVVLLYKHVFIITKGIVSSQSAEIDRMRNGRVYSIDLVNKINKKSKITECEAIKFRLSKQPMLLTDIFCSKVYFSDLSERSHISEHMVEISIAKFYYSSPTIIYSTSIQLNDGENHIKLTNPIKIEEDRSYAIVMKSNTLWDDRYTFEANIPEKKFLAPNILISFENVKNKPYTCSLIHNLYFERID